ncbi:MAG: NUDIX domain-containing protein [Candidatus Nomurabacteria bacterium]|jgi:mutator protein MutT|nr:NUDIX domain-containing protein [Candidatus Nomurabacteria bacterium]
MNTDRQLFRAAVYVIFRNDKNEILLIRRFNTGWRDGEYTLPAGHIDPGETAVQTCIHEAREEVGLEIKSEDLQLVHIAHCNKDSNYINFYFNANEYNGVAKNGEPDKADDLQWMSIDNLDKLPIIDTVKDALRHIVRGENLSFWGF